MGYEHVQGIHDMVVHDYGPGRRFLSVHAEVPADGEILKLHEVFTNLLISNERKRIMTRKLSIFPVFYPFPYA